MTVIPALTALLVAEFGKSSLDFTSIGLRERLKPKLHEKRVEMTILLELVLARFRNVS